MILWTLGRWFRMEIRQFVRMWHAMGTLKIILSKRFSLWQWHLYWKSHWYVSVPKIGWHIGGLRFGKSLQLNMKNTCLWHYIQVVSILTYHPSGFHKTKNYILGHLTFTSMLVLLTVEIRSSHYGHSPVVWHSYQLSWKSINRFQSASTHARTRARTHTHMHVHKDTQAFTNRKKSEQIIFWHNYHLKQ
jgi:hypothetical protein